MTPSEWQNIPPANQREYDEQFVLAQLLDDPQGNAWELAGLTPSFFEFPDHRLIATAMCAVRDSGQRVHWRRVRSLVRPGASRGRTLVSALRLRAGASFGLTAAISRLHVPSVRKTAWPTTQEAHP